MASEQTGGGRVKAALVGVALVLSGLPGRASTIDTRAVWRGIDTAGMDTSVKPTDDLFRYANGRWLDAAVIPPDHTLWGIGEVMEERNLLLLHAALDEAAADSHAPRRSDRRKVGDLFASGMDTGRIESLGARPITPQLRLIAGAGTVPELLTAIGRLHAEGIFPCFASGAGANPVNGNEVIFWVGTNDSEGGLGLPDRDYYLDTDAKTVEIRRQYLAHVEKMMALLGDGPEEAKAESQAVMAIETELAHVALDKVARRDPYATYHLMTLKEMDALTPGVAWERYFKAMRFAPAGKLDVGNPAYVTKIGQMLAAGPMARWKSYLRWNVVNTCAQALSSDFVKEDFHFKSTVLNGVEEMRPRWQQVHRAVDANLGEALGRVYVERAFPPDAKARALALALNVKAALRDQLNTLPWMSTTTRAKAIEKLGAMTVKVGYPDRWRDYSALSIDRKQYAGNLIRAGAFEYRRQLNKIGKPRDRDEWDMTPPTINAYYDPTLNQIVFPAGVLQPPDFDPTVDDAVNYGNAGATIGHEITHGFDDEGRKYDGAGNLHDWWTADDAKNYEARSALIKSQYNDFVAVDNLHVNGGLTVGENTADIGGLKIAWLAFQRALKAGPRPGLIDGFTPEQRFFIAFAQSWREKRRPESLRLQVNVDPHSPERLRVVGPVSLMPEFYQAFGQPVPAWVSERASQAIW